MKRCTLITGLVLMALTVLVSPGMGEVPQVINYQGRLTDAGGSPVPDMSYQIIFTIYSDPGGATTLWSSGAAVIPVQDGLFEYQLGSAVPLPDDLFTDTLRWLGISVDGQPDMVPRTKLTSVAFAYHALRADTAANIEAPLVLTESVPDLNAVIEGHNTGGGYGVFGINSGANNSGLLGSTFAGASGTAELGHGVWGYAISPIADGVRASCISGTMASLAGETYAGYFQGRVEIIGELGIGTPSPVSELDVDGTARMTGFWLPNGPADGYVLTSDGAGHGTWQAPAGGFANGWVDDGTVVRLETATDRVGIGISSPADNLEIYQDVDATVGISISNPNTGPNSRERLSFNNEHGTVAGIQMEEVATENVMSIFNNRSPGMIEIYANGPNGVIIRDNFVGIGTTNPNEFLDIAGTARMMGFNMPSGAAAGLVLTADNTGTGTWQPATSGIGGSGMTDFVPKFLSSTTLGSSGIIDVAGNIGIGMNAPGNHRLYVSSPNGGVPGATAFIENISGAGIAMIAENNSSDLTMLASQLGSGPILRCDSYTGGWHPVFSIQNDGRTMIGSAANPAGLELYGDAIFHDSTMVVDANGVRVGDGDPPSASYLMHLTRTYDNSSIYWRYGLFSSVINRGTGPICGIRGSAENSSTPSGVVCDQYGVRGDTYGSEGDRYGVHGRTSAVSSSNKVGESYGVFGNAFAGENTYGVYGEAEYGYYAYGVYGKATLASTANWAGYFEGNVNVTGTVSKGGGSFKIDHPLDPENKYLLHSFVESPDMMNVYNGNIVLDAAGEAVVQLPDYFEALNSDFRYQLTAIGAPGPNLYIADEITGTSFRIAGGEAGMKVSWQVTGVRKDAFAEANRIPVEMDKPERERGLYLHPEAFNLSDAQSIHSERNQKLDKHQEALEAEELR